MSQTATYKIDDSQVRAWSKVLAMYPELAEPIVVTAMKKSIYAVVAEIKPRTPVNEGDLLGSIAGRVETLGTIGQIGGEIRGIAESNLDYAFPVEIGRQPGTWVPIEPLKRWARLVLGDEGAAYAVRAKIYSKGIKGRFMFARGWMEARPLVKGFFLDAQEEIIDAVASRARKGR